jgi:hypothetical protein
MRRKVKQNGTGYSGPSSTRPTQPQESDVANEGGTAPGGTVAFMGAASQWSTSNAASRNNFPTGSPNIDPVTAAKMQHVGLADESPAEKGDVPVHPGIMPGKFRTAADANPNAPDGEVPAAHSTGINKIRNDPTANDGRGFRGESPEVLKNSRGAYRR